MMTKEQLNPPFGSGTCLFVRKGDDFAVAAIDSRRNTQTGLACKITCVNTPPPKGGGFELRLKPDRSAIRRT
jgi:hypothetical protein